MMVGFGIFVAVIAFLSGSHPCDAVKEAVCQCCWGCPKHCSPDRMKNIRRKKKLNDNWPGFHVVETFDGKNQRTKEQLCRLANDESIGKIFQRPQYRLVIDKLYELPPIRSPKVTVRGDQYTIEYVSGINAVTTYHTAYYGNYGSVVQTIHPPTKRWKIGILLRMGLSSIPHSKMVDTLLHELAHCHHENDSNAFYAEWNELRRLYQTFEWERRIAYAKRKIKQLIRWSKKHAILTVSIVLGGALTLAKIGLVMTRRARLREIQRAEHLSKAKPKISFTLSPHFSF